jgi:acyl carrier protein
VLVESADVAREEEVSRVLARVEREAPPLKGLFHAAGLLDDSTLLRMDDERFRRALAPKVAGAWNLHARTLDRPLELFVLFSSATSVLGSPGQANYAAGNAFLDALAHHRHALGLPALSINWGPWAEVGLAAAQENRGERLAYRGLGSLSVAQGLEALGRLVRGSRVQAGVMPLNLRQWRQSYPKAAASPFLAPLAREGDGAGSVAEAEAAVRAALLAAEPTARHGMLEAHLLDQVARVLRLAPSRVGARTPLSSLGLDSLMGLELRNRLEASLGVTLPGTLLWTYPTVAALVPHLASKMGLALEAPAPAHPAPPPKGDALAATAAKIEQLSDEEMEALLLEKLKNL